MTLQYPERKFLLHEVHTQYKANIRTAQGYKNNTHSLTETRHSL